MRIVSLVPSWTETLIAAGGEVVGRTRFCVHPAASVEAIPAVGGTKDIDWEAVAALRPDLVLLDREENPESFADDCPFPFHATHVRGISDLEPELRALAARTKLAELERLAERWSEAAKRPHAPKKSGDSPLLIPGILEEWRGPGTDCGKLVYIIWKNPWMAAARGTFVASMLAHFGWGDAILPSVDEKYPKVDFDAIAREAGGRERVCLLFASEPFPFARYKEEGIALGFSCGLLDGEAYSWFGLRSLEFLERATDFSAKTR